MGGPGRKGLGRLTSPSCRWHSLMISCLLIRQGSMVVAVSKDLERAHLGVPGAFVFLDPVGENFGI